MKILRLGTSQDEQPGISAEASLNTLLRKGLEAELGEPVELIMKRAWPTARLPGLMRQWMDEVEPDMVCITTTPYWFMYQSVPLKLKRRFGKVGVAVGDAGQKAANVNWLAHNAVFRAGRSVATRIIGGASPFTPDEVVEALTGCIREAVRHEGVIVFVDGPPGFTRYGENARTINRLEKDRLYVTARLAEVCAKYHVVFKSYEKPLWMEMSLERSGDGLHLTAVANDLIVRPYISLMGTIVRESREREGRGAGR